LKTTSTFAIAETVFSIAVHDDEVCLLAGRY
jgi:hypothetical protein